MPPVRAKRDKAAHRRAQHLQSAQARHVHRAQLAAGLLTGEAVYGSGDDGSSGRIAETGASGVGATAVVKRQQLAAVQRGSKAAALPSTGKVSLQGIVSADEVAGVYDAAAAASASTATRNASSGSDEDATAVGRIGASLTKLQRGQDGFRQSQKHRRRQRQVETDVVESYDIPQEILALRKNWTRKQKTRVINYLLRKQRNRDRAQLFDEFAQAALTTAEQGLMQSTRTLGQTDTRKQRLERSHFEAEAGVPQSQPENRLMPSTNSERFSAEKGEKLVAASLELAELGDRLAIQQQRQAAMAKLLQNKRKSREDRSAETAYAKRFFDRPAGVLSASDSASSSESEETIPATSAPAARFTFDSKRQFADDTASDQSTSARNSTKLDRNRGVNRTGTTDCVNVIDDVLMQDDDGSHDNSSEHSSSDSGSGGSDRGGGTTIDVEVRSEFELASSSRRGDGEDNSAQPSSDGGCSPSDSGEPSSGSEQPSSVDEEEDGEPDMSSYFDKIVLRQPAHMKDNGGEAPGDKMLKSRNRAVTQSPFTLERAFFVSVQRTPEITSQRQNLPVVSEEQMIMECVGAHHICIICGETGSGKTTQVPQFLYEAGFGNPSHPLFPGRIGVTQPRRVAAMSTAKRVCSELNQSFGSEVGYQVRYDSSTVSRTQNKIKFMTDGVLLREIQTDFLLSEYSCVILDEAHERNMNTDVLIGLLSRIVPLRNTMFVNGQSHKGDKVLPLKLIIMSATLRVTDFTENFKLFPEPPPVVQVKARQFPVTIHFNKRTPDDYLEETIKKVSKLHTTLPPGGVLIFLTGQQEIEYVCRKLRALYGPIEMEKRRRARRRVRRGSRKQDARKSSEYMPSTEASSELLNSRARSHSSSEHEFESSSSSSSRLSDSDSSDQEDVALHVLPLFSALPVEQQQRIFERSETSQNSSRLCVVSTNVAETSLTIPGISYVIDCGKEKQLRYNPISGVQEFVIDWISKASADQRAGRAGRTGPGHVYRLYSSNAYGTRFAQFSPPEILTTPVDAVCLQMKAMGINDVVRFPFPTPPPVENLRVAERLLITLGALILPRQRGVDSRITPLGRLMAAFPVSPRFAKILALALPITVSSDALSGDNGASIAYAIALVAVLSVRDPLRKGKFNELSDDDESSVNSDAESADAMRRKTDRRRKHIEAARNRMLKALGQLACEDSDVLTTLRAVGAYEFTLARANSERNAVVRDFCEQKFLDPKIMSEIHSLSLQLRSIVDQVLAELRGGNSPRASGGEAAEDGLDRNELILTRRLADARGETAAIPSLAVAPPPHTAELRRLRKVLAGGFVDRVARRVVVQNIGNKSARKAGSSNDRKKLHGVGGVAYELLLSRSVPDATDEEMAFIHPQSLLHSRPPEFVIFRDARKAGDGAMDSEGRLLKSARLYLHGVTAIDSEWLIQLGGPGMSSMRLLEMPAPFFDVNTGTLRCFVRTQFGSKKWELPPCETRFAPLLDLDYAAVYDDATFVDSNAFYRHFAKLLLEGKVFPKLGAFVALYTTRPSACLSVSNQLRVTLLVQQLRESKIQCQADCVREWTSNPSWLKAAVANWLDRSRHQALFRAWPPL